MAILNEGVEPEEASGHVLIDEVLSANKDAPELEPYRVLGKDKAQSFELTDAGLLLRNGSLVVPGDVDPTLRTRVLREIHDRLPSAHPGRNKTRVLARSKY